MKKKNKKISISGIVLALAAMKKKSRIIIAANAILAVTALALGLLIYQQQLGKNTIDQEKPSRDSEIFSSENFTSSSYNNENDALRWPAQNASSEEKQRHADLIRRVAQDSEFLSINSDCSMQPAVFRVTLEESFTIRNQDDVGHTITVNEDNIFVVPAGSTKNVIADFGQGRGNYGFLCDSKQGVAGILVVAP
ncbi:MAG: hypothetical protein IIC74_05835 [Bacteroidetes bacterium]|nr:hypothetical protein [Bacteroidota bacterium]